MLFLRLVLFSFLFCSVLDGLEFADSGQSTRIHSDCSARSVCGLQLPNPRLSGIQEMAAGHHCACVRTGLTGASQWSVNVPEEGSLPNLQECRQGGRGNILERPLLHTLYVLLGGTMLQHCFF